MPLQTIENETKVDLAQCKAYEMSISNAEKNVTYQEILKKAVKQYKAKLEQNLREKNDTNQYE